MPIVLRLFHTENRRGEICATKAKIRIKATSARTRRNYFPSRFCRDNSQRTTTGTCGPEFPSTFLTLCSPRHRLPPPRRGKRGPCVFPLLRIYTRDCGGVAGAALTLAGVRESVAAWPVMSWQHRVLRWRAFRRPLRRAVACPGEAGPRW